MFLRPFNRHISQLGCNLAPKNRIISNDVQRIFSIVIQDAMVNELWKFLLI